MKTLYSLSIFLLVFATGFAQDVINYKAMINDLDGNVLVNENISARFSILNDTGIKYTETHSTTTDNNGIIILNIGDGTPDFLTYNNVDWKLANFSLKVEINSGIGFVDMGTTPFNTVPYALEVLNPVFEKDGDNATKLIGNIGIGTNNPLEKLHVNDATDASILITTDNFNNSSTIRLENGTDNDSQYNHFKIENKGNALSIAKASALTSGTYIKALNINQNLGFEFTGSMQLNNGPYISEFSNGNIQENSDSKVPTQAAVKEYVDAVAYGEKTITIPFSSFVPNNSLSDIAYSFDGVYSQSNFLKLKASITLPEGATITNIKYYVLDNDPNADIEIRIYGTDLQVVGGDFASTFLTTSGSQTGSIELSQNLNEIYNQNIIIFIEVNNINGVASTNLGIRGAKITYTE